MSEPGGDDRRLCAEAKLIDLHVDFLIQQHLFGYDPHKEHRPGIQGQPFVWHTDLPRMRDAGYGAGLPPAFTIGRGSHPAVLRS